MFKYCNEKLPGLSNDCGIYNVDIVFLHLLIQLYLSYRAAVAIELKRNHKAMLRSHSFWVAAPIGSDAL